jgi:hypothetical protein
MAATTLQYYTILGLGAIRSGANKSELHFSPFLLFLEFQVEAQKK